MKVIGLTGGIGTGKSTAAKYLVDKGFAHIDADKIGAEITADGSPVLKTLDEVFGPEGEMGVPGTAILDENGNLNRKALASVVFTDSKKTDKLNSIMFSKIIADIHDKLDTMKGQGVNAVLLDAPLLFEAGVDTLCDSVVLITADKDTKIQRVCKRDGVTPEDVKNRIDKQLDDSEKIKKSDYIIDNSSDLDNLHKQLEEIYKIVVDKY